MTETNRNQTQFYLLNFPGDKSVEEGKEQSVTSSLKKCKTARPAYVSSLPSCILGDTSFSCIMQFVSRRATCARIQSWLRAMTFYFPIFFFVTSPQNRAFSFFCPKLGTPAHPKTEINSSDIFISSVISGGSSLSLFLTNMQ